MFGNLVVRRRLGCFLSVLFLLVSCAGKQPLSSGDLTTDSASKHGMLTLIYLSNRYGSLEPCGCKINPYGGIDREANAVRSIRKEQKNVLYVDAGNAFLSPKAKGGLEHHKQKAETITEILNQMGLDAFAPGIQDLELGVDFLKALAAKAKFKFVSTNIVGADGKPLFAPYLIEEKAGLRIGIISITPPTELADKSLKIQNPKEALANAMTEIKGKADVVILLSQLKNTESEALVKDFPEVSIVVGGDPNLATDKAFWWNAGKTLYVDSSNEGHLLGRLDLDLYTPVKGFSSYAIIQENLASIKELEEKIAKEPNETLQNALKNLKEKSPLEAIPGGSGYANQLIRLDAKNFGSPNDITKLLRQEKERVRQRALKKK